ncbi:substrate-binding periplasmic protein [Tabrizicola sp.]|uniref:substrate-binding periplasmic protein n=1 Tax=Tabrizicola sp. TaxID=2005166 RepID=UPI003F3273DC
MRALFLAAMIAGLAGPAFARCESVVPAERPQNTPYEDVGREFDAIVDSGWIEFAVYEDFRPWSWEQDGKAAGVDVEIGKLIAGALGVEARFRLVQAGENLDADLQNYVWKGAAIGGRVSDVMLHVPYDSDYACRVEQVVFTGQYVQDGVAIAYDAAKYPEKGPTPSYFRYDTVGVENDSISDFYLTSVGQLGDTVHRYKSTLLAMDALAAGEIMAVMGPKGEIEGNLAPGITVHEPPMMGFERGHWTLGVGISEQHRDLAYAVDDAVASALADGRIAAIFAAHGMSFGPPER